MPIFLLALNGCDNAMFDNSIRSAVRERLKDPDSAKFEEQISFKNFACIKYNAKNGYGGYGGASWAILKQGTTGWQVEEMSVDYCSESRLQAMAETKELDVAELVAPKAVPQTWLCEDENGHRYKVSQDVPIDSCRLLEPSEIGLDPAAINVPKRDRKQTPAS